MRTYVYVHIYVARKVFEGVSACQWFYLLSLAHCYACTYIRTQSVSLRASDHTGSGGRSCRTTTRKSGNTVVTETVCS